MIIASCRDREFNIWVREVSIYEYGICGARAAELYSESMGDYSPV